MSDDKSFASSGHKLGQIIGDWFEEYFAYPLLARIAQNFKLQLNSRFIPGTNTIWKDSEGNSVNYDFVMCIPNTQIPVAFFETFWRRGARHSKDKSRDDCGKLIPMNFTYSTTRVLSIIAAGDFTSSAREYVQSMGITLFYVVKHMVISTWQRYGLEIDYPDNLEERQKANLLKLLEAKLNCMPDWGNRLAGELISSPEVAAQIKFYTAMLYSRLGATPVEYRITLVQKSFPLSFTSYEAVDDFLNGERVPGNFIPHIDYIYEVDFGNGDFFKRENLSFDGLWFEHNSLKCLIRHMEAIAWNNFLS